MKLTKGSNIKLRREVFKSDALEIINWLEDNEVTQYLNEDKNVNRSIKEVIHRVNMPILTHLFNQRGTFFMITTKEETPIGFLKLIPKNENAEMVVVIGDKKRWSKGLGPKAILEGLKHAFFNWRVGEVIAKINFKNRRSQKAFKKVGFTKDKELAREVQYSISMDEFFELVS